MIIRLSLTELRDIGRATQGVKLMNLEDDDRIISVAIFKHDEDDGEASISTEEGQQVVEVSPENQ